MASYPPPREPGKSDRQLKWEQTIAKQVGEVSSGGAPTTASYLTLSNDATLANERVLTAGTNISLVDGGAGTTLTINATGGVTDHGALTGLSDDDHAQYHNNARGDARYSQLGHTHTVSQITDYVNTTAATIGLVIDGGGAAITTGLKGFVRVPFNCTITGWDIVADQSGSIVVDVWKDTYANFPPTVGDSVAGTEKPTLSAAQKNQDLTLSTWMDVTFSADDWVAFNVDSASTVTRVILQLRATRT